eukprot:GHVU01096511.1.p1 GENE.GHVU01096511.1~~GHVU01096511.1.p1  ORF type:complete len:217 (+),score=32.97 GHVU01096511.1:63-713(+)
MWTYLLIDVPPYVSGCLLSHQSLCHRGNCPTIIPAYLRACVRTCLPACVPACVPVCLPVCVCVCVCVRACCLCVCVLLCVHLSVCVCLLLSSSSSSFSSSSSSSSSFSSSSQGDAISMAYTGTGSVFSQVIKQGKSSLTSNLDHAFRSLGRLYKNTFEDSGRQEGYELLLGTHRCSSMHRYDYRRPAASTHTHLPSTTAGTGKAAAATTTGKAESQ